MKESEVINLLSMYVAFLRALYHMHRDCHWRTQKYSNHLLFQRFYEAVEEDVDAAAEKAIGLTGSLNNQTKYMSAVINNYEKIDNFKERMLKAENDFVKLSNKTYNKIKEGNFLTLGLDDLIMSLANNSEVRIYLLKQCED